ncbi:hypothetical protein M5D96_006583, partial [Drosophila gunungcola]
MGQIESAGYDKLTHRVLEVEFDRILGPQPFGNLPALQR